MQLNIFYMMLEKLQAFTTAAGYDLQNSGDVESIYIEKQGNASEQLQDLSITKRGMSTAQLLSQNRVTTAATAGPTPLRTKADSIGSSSGSRFTPPLSRGNSTTSTAGAGTGAGTGRVLAPPPYSPSGVAGAPLSSPGLSGKRAPPPPPTLKPRPSTGPKPTMVTALYDFQAQSDGDLSFQTGDRITIIEKSESSEDWWVGSLNGMKGSFPANYCKLD